MAHLVVVVAILAMLRLGEWQWHRAEAPSGGLQNYAYAAQWPLFAVFGLVVWVKTLIEEVRRDPSQPRNPRTVALAPEKSGIMRQPGVRVGVSTQRVHVDEDDDETQAWNARLAALNAASASVESRRKER